MDSFSFWLYIIWKQLEPRQRILTDSNSCGRITLTVLLLTILGAVSGILYAGGGMFFSNIIISAWKGEVPRGPHQSATSRAPCHCSLGPTAIISGCHDQIRTAAGTGCFMMTIVMVCMAFTFIGRTNMDDISNLYLMLLTLPFGVAVRAPTAYMLRKGYRLGC